MWNKIKKILLIMIVVSLVLPTSALDLISSVYAQVSQSSNVEMQNFDALNDLLETSTSQQENTDEIEGVETEGEASPKEETPSDDVQTPTEEEQAPSDIEVPNEGEEAPSDVETPTEEEDIPSDDVQTPTEEEQAPSDEIETPVEEEDSLDEEEFPTEEEVVEEDEVVEEEEISLDSDITFTANIRLLNPYIAKGTENLYSSYNWNGYQASAAADSNTSDEYTRLTSSMSSENDGAVWLDKSVTLDSNFNYIDNLAISNGDFNVILSALGQGYNVESTAKTPANVVFVLDVSGSMKYKLGKDEWATKDSETRAYAMVKAVNLAIKQLVSQNPQTKIGIVTFSEGSQQFLPLNNYTSTGDYLTYTGKNYGGWWEPSGNISISEAVEPKVSKTVNVTGGTYTQAGIKAGADMLISAANSDRVPALFILSDGEPTYGNTSYETLDSNYKFGNGMANQQDADKMGYYTILTAIHHKQLVTNAYSRNTLLYTVGLGVTGLFGQTVLNPTLENYNSCSSKGSSTNEKKLYNLLKDSTLYKKESYADYSKSGTLTEDDLKQLLLQFANAVTNVSKLPFESGTSVQFEDQLGTGMQLRGNSVYVRYNGNNYEFTKQEDGTFTSTDALFTGMSIKLRESEGAQTVIWNIPQNLVPLITKDANGNFVSALPIRLIYTVGLKSDVSPGTYYTNAFNEVTKTPLTTATFTAASDNPYYLNGYSHTDSKENNVTSTADYYTSMNLNTDTRLMTTLLGNNGKVTLINPTTSVTATKVWDDENNQYGLRPESISVQLYENGTTKIGDSVEVSGSEDVTANWTYTWPDLPTMCEENRACSYSVKEETVPYGYEVSYVDSLTIKNTLKTISKTVEKVWVDNGDEFRENIWVQLYQGDTTFGDPVELKASDDWKYTWSKLPKMCADNRECVYSVKEVTELSNYVTSYSEDTFTITNTLIQGTLNIEKTDKDNIALKDVEFLLQKQNADGSWTEGQKLTTVSNGQVQITDLLVGRYCLTETKTNENYQLLDSVIEFNIPYDVTTVSKPNGVTFETSTSEEHRPIITIKVTNHKNGIFENLPATGGKGITMFMIGGSALSGLAISLYIRAERKNKRSAKL
ncbi:LPXTG-motif cell wall anchor domain protein [Turicibacter sanguinis PC909]|uniref:LPXTG-motif cell wall anchor domain protein n=2 Tax=Turicibacter TaxID=191303 RepID=A0ABP2I461_9FIRM|nr:Cna B-type domain-containing protein [Turicibacter sanguinis]EFF65023.1 LPXTG-motif cell wall anchor domain protein [Turicibacter sanguinis PC909]MCU7191965.1 Cna B-type domain-containing protein [Turicibacter sanguinis]